MTDTFRQIGPTPGYGSVTGASLAGTSVAGLTEGRVNGSEILPLWIVGDSNCIGSGAQYVGGWRAGLEAALRKLRSDFDFVGHVATLNASGAVGSLAWHSAVSGDSIGAATSALSTRLAACIPSPQAVVVCLGTNDLVAGQTAAQMETSWTAYKAALFAALPTAHVFVVAPPVFVAGASVGGSLSTWNGVRTTYVAWLAADCANDSRITYIDPCATTPPAVGPGDYQEGVHFNRIGNASFGRAIADSIDAWMSAGGRRGGTLPRAFAMRPRCGSAIIDAAGDIRITTGNGVDIPGTSHFAIAFDVYPTALAAGPLAMLQIGPRHAEPSTWLAVRQLGTGIDLGGYDGSAAWVTTGSAQDYALVVNHWHRIVAILYRGATGASVVGLYCNGALVGMLYGLASTWPASAQTLYIGNSPDYVSCPGNYSNLRAWAGANVPRPGSMAALRAVEDNWYLDAPIVPGGGTSTRELDNSLTDDVSGNGGASYVGGAAGNVTAANTPRRPWEWPLVYPP